MNDERDDTPQVVEFAGVRFGPDDVTEMDGEQVMVKVARRDIKSITLRHGFHSAHPLTQVVAGAVLTAIGLLPTWHFAYWLVRGGTFTTIEAVMMGFVFLGPWVMVDAMKRGPYLEVRTAAGSKKVVFDRKADREMLEQAVGAAEQLLGYDVERAGRGEMHQRPAEADLTERD